MERDFMGLNSKESVVVKDEFVEGGCEDSGFAGNSGVPWPLSNKVSAVPQFMSLKSEQVEFMHKQQSGNIQKFGVATVKQQFIGGNPNSILPSAASVAGTIEECVNSKALNVPAQLTIFYGGSVSVFDGISPEKAQAIMFLAGNVYSQSNTTQSKLHMQAPASKLPAADQVALVNKSMNTPPSSGHPSPMSVSSHPIDESGVPGANNDDIKVSVTAGMSTSLVNKVEPRRVISSVGSVAASAIISSAVPQARKASLARFLEKRKERAMSAAPYKKTSDCGIPESNDFGFSSTSGMCTSSLSIRKEID